MRVPRQPSMPKDIATTPNKKKNVTRHLRKAVVVSVVSSSSLKGKSSLSLFWNRETLSSLDGTGVFFRQCAASIYRNVCVLVS